jgi:hypothetical protein
MSFDINRNCGSEGEVRKVLSVSRPRQVVVETLTELSTLASHILTTTETHSSKSADEAPVVWNFGSVLHKDKIPNISNSRSVSASDTARLALGRFSGRFIAPQESSSGLL